MMDASKEEFTGGTLKNTHPLLAASAFCPMRKLSALSEIYLLLLFLANSAPIF